MSRISESFSKLRKKEAWVLEPEAATFAPNNKWSNKDMDPVPKHLRTWNSFDFVAYWMSDAANVATWNMASSMIAIGLSWKHAISAIAVGHFLIALVITANGTIGARLHVPFPVINRSSFGFYFSYFSVISRAILAMFWFGVQTYTGGECVYQMLKAIWPGTARIPNHLPESANITTSVMMCFFLYWLIQLPFLLVPVHKIRWLFIVKAVLVPACWLSMMIWALVKTKGAHGGVFSVPSTLSGSAATWGWFSALNSALGNFATLAVNIPDFTRFAKSPRAQYTQIAVIPVVFTFFAFIGIVVTSTGYTLYGNVYLWDPLTLIDKWDNRAAAFFASFCFALATIATNIGANSISAANDLTALAPRFINIRRGQIICAIVGAWIMCPWEILASASGFLTFMGGYTIVLGPIAAIMIVDYFVLRKGKNVDVPSLYRPHGRYRYMGGVNLRALAALIVSVPPNLPGLISSINTDIHVGGGIYLYNIAYLLGFTLAAGVYYGLSVLFPPTETLIDAPITGDDHGAVEHEHADEESLEEEKKPHGATATVATIST